MTFEEYKNLVEEEQEKAIKYDFREEIINFSTTDPCDRNAVYHAVGIAEDPEYKKEAPGVNESHEIYRKYKTEERIITSNGEADSCSLIREISSILYCDKYLSLCLDEGLIKVDTMNSVNTTLNKLLKPKGKWSKAKTVHLYYSDHKKYQEQLKQAKIFLEAAYTIGNFIPWPVACNGPRGFNNSQIQDYWDLTLYYIYRWYMENPEVKISNNDPLVALLNGKKDPINNFQNWLAAFGSWDNFVEANYMQDFVLGECGEDGARVSRGGHFGLPKELWKGHFDAVEEPTRRKVLPFKGKIGDKEIDQFSEFFQNAADCIKARSRRMVEALRHD